MDSFNWMPKIQCDEATRGNPGQTNQKKKKKRGNPGQTDEKNKKRNPGQARTEGQKLAFTDLDRTNNSSDAEVVAIRKFVGDSKIIFLGFDNGEHLR